MCDYDCNIFSCFVNLVGDCTIRFLHMHVCEDHTKIKMLNSLHMHARIHIGRVQWTWGVSDAGQGQLRLK